MKRMIPKTPRMRCAALGLLAGGLLAVNGAGAAATSGRLGDAAYKAEVESWRQEQDERLKADDSWLTVAGLFFLAEGENRFGTGISNDIVLPEGSAPKEVGVFEYRNGRTTVRAAPGTTVTVNGAAVETAVLDPVSGDTPADLLTVRDLTLFVHVSGDRKAIRLRDQNSRIRREFTGRRWFPVDEAFRVTGRFVPLSESRPMNVPNILGDTEHYTTSGHIVFELGGRQHRMVAVDVSNGLWLIFRDTTSGQETYGAARFLRTTPPEDGEVVVDFNRAYNPPCAFNPYTTCPLPPRENRMPIRVAAGELTYGDR